MKNIQSIALEKYSSKKLYEEVENGIYKDLKNKRYVTTLRFELEENENFQYPLEDILDKFYVNCTEHMVEEGNEVEVELEDGNDDNFESLDTIKEIVALVGKRVFNEKQNGVLKLVIADK
ncbi:hypothetical protein [Enterococcus rivorum]|uniref:Uncharacterized protein n=2 Tax=Enterococcus rivorum TaxID=762845 RepID=A0A1E5KTH3_9ENTE|nr:hypothetical protein [Enterococcus rivorum]MBP2097997.1 hypothetical protein [Enterococcus rivorum]OEH81156.1 hypothetical protein BCR26_04730 [Enterococcus rivorum]